MKVSSVCDRLEIEKKKNLVLYHKQFRDYCRVRNYKWNLRVPENGQAQLVKVCQQLSRYRTARTLPALLHPNND